MRNQFDVDTRVPAPELLQQPRQPSEIAAGAGSDPHDFAHTGAQFAAITLGRFQPLETLLEDIRDFTDTDTFDNRGYRSPGELSLHTDPPTLIMLFCLTPAREGGENQLVNIEAIHDYMQAQRFSARCVAVPRPHAPVA